MRIKANGITFNYTVDGAEGAPWLVFSNSLATTVAMWDEQAAALKGRYRVLRYDQRGHGGTDAPAGRYAFDTLVGDARALMDALGIKKRILPSCRWVAPPRSVWPSAARTASI